MRHLHRRIPSPGLSSAPPPLLLPVVPVTTGAAKMQYRGPQVLQINTVRPDGGGVPSVKGGDRARAPMHTGFAQSLHHHHPQSPLLMASLLIRSPFMSQSLFHGLSVSTATGTINLPKPLVHVLSSIACPNPSTSTKVGPVCNTHQASDETLFSMTRNKEIM